MAGETWIKVRMYLSSAKVAQRLAAICKQDAQKAAGVLIDFWSSVSDNATNGFIRDYSDATLEDWAKWRGKKGAFAKWVRAHHMDADGRVPDWDEYMGTLEARRAYDRQRKELVRVRRKSTGQSDGSPPDSPQDVRTNSIPAHADGDGDGDGYVKKKEINPPPTTAREETAGEIAFLQAVPPDRCSYWRAVISSWYSGQNYPQNRPADARDVSAGLLEYLASAKAPDFSPRHVRSFVVTAEVQRLASAVDRPPRRFAKRSMADETYDNALAGALAVQQLAKEKAS